MPFGTYPIIDELLKQVPKKLSKITDTLFVVPAGCEDLIGKV